MRRLWPLALAGLAPAAAVRLGEQSGRSAGSRERAVPGGEEERASFLSLHKAQLAPPEHRGLRLGAVHYVANRSSLASNGSLLPFLAEDVGNMSASLPPVPVNAQLSMRHNTCRQLIVPVVVLVVGGLMSIVGKSMRSLSQLLLFFGAQTFMNLYMKAVLSTSVVQEIPKMTGFQAPLLLTAVQQLVSFAVLIVMLFVLRVVGFSWRPRRIQSAQECFMILFLAVCFSANIALNNFSLSLIDMSANVMIRSTSPVTALFLQLLFRNWFKEALDQITLPKMMFLVAGIACAVLVVLSKGQHASDKEFGDLYVLGIVLCISSILSSSMELVLVVMIGKTIKLNAIETILYMSLPVVAILVIPSFCIRHVVAYQAHPPSTDWHVFLEVWRLSPQTTTLVFLSGLFALAYNVLLYAVVADLSPFYTSFAANFNKVGAIALALIFGFEHLPAKPWSYVMVLAVVGNMCSFTAYSVWRQPEAKKP